MIIKPGKDTTKAMKLWNDGLLDVEACKKMGCTALQFGVWRRRLKLPNNRGIFDWVDDGYCEEGTVEQRYGKQEDY